MNAQRQSKKMSSFKRKRDESENEENSVLKELSVNIKKTSILTPHETSDIHLSKDNENNMISYNPCVVIKKTSPEKLTTHEISALHLSKDDESNELNSAPSLYENGVSNSQFYVIKKNESDDSVLTESEVSIGTSFTEEDSSSKEVEDSAKINKKSKVVVKPSLSLDEKLTYLKKLMAISNAYSKYVSKNLAKASTLTKASKDEQNQRGCAMDSIVRSLCTGFEKLDVTHTNL